jgi:hypothetical protein
MLGKWQPMAREIQTDLESARVLLDGLVETDERGRLRLRYFKEGSPDELNARRALATLLRSGEELDHRLRESLAELFDPAPPERQQRKLAFAFRRRGKKTDHYANTQIFVEVHAAIKSGSTVTAAIADIAEEYCRSAELVKKIWSQYRRKYPVDPRRSGLTEG